MRVATTMALAGLLVSPACVGKRRADASADKQDAVAATPRVMTTAPAVEPPSDPAPTVERPKVAVSERNAFESKRPEAAMLKTGDLVFVHASTKYAQGLEAKMPGEVNHVGLVFVTADGPQVVATEEVLRQVPYDRWLQTTSATHIVVKRLADAETLLTDEKLRPLKQFTFSARGRAYDDAFGWDDETLYASEYVHKAFARGPGIELGHKQTLASLPVQVVTPTSILDDSRLTTVFQAER